jgi:hypothetical protein
MRGFGLYWVFKIISAKGGIMPNEIQLNTYGLQITVISSFPIQIPHYIKTGKIYCAITPITLETLTQNRIDNSKWIIMFVEEKTNLEKLKDFKFTAKQVVASVMLNQEKPRLEEIKEKDQPTVYAFQFSKEQSNDIATVLKDRVFPVLANVPEHINHYNPSFSFAEEESSKTENRSPSPNPTY